MDRNTLIGLLLIGAIFVGYLLLNRTSEEDIEKGYKGAIRKGDSIYELVRKDSLLDTIQLKKAVQAYSQALAWKREEPYPRQQLMEIDSLLRIYVAQQEKQTGQKAEIPDTSADFQDTSIIDQETIIRKKMERKYGAFANSATGEPEMITLENDLIKLLITNKGGRIYAVELKKFTTQDRKSVV